MMLRTVYGAAAVLVLAWSASAAASDGPTTGVAPSAMTNASIAQHNAALTPADPAFIKCRRIAIAGSLVKKARVCKTNAEWKKAWQVGNQDARDTFDAMNRGSSNSLEPADEFTPPGARPN